jgi:hypothetical protein
MTCRVCVYACSCVFCVCAPLICVRVTASSKPFRDMLEEKTAKCGKPVMQSLSLGQPSCANDPEPKVYLL